MHCRTCGNATHICELDGQRYYSFLLAASRSSRRAAMFLSTAATSAARSAITFSRSRFLSSGLGLRGGRAGVLALLRLGELWLQCALSVRWHVHKGSD